MTDEEKEKILDAALKWEPDFLLRKLNEIISKPPVREMLHDRIPEDLLQQIDECSVDLRDYPILHGIFDNKEKVKLAKLFLANNKKQIERFSQDLYTEVMDVIKEIDEDLKWSKSKQGSLVLAIEDWLERNKNSIPGNEEKTIVMGRNIFDDNPCNIIIGGYSKRMSNIEIEDFILGLNPPVQPLFIILNVNAVA